MGDLPAIAYARPVSGRSLHVPAQLLNVDGTVSRKGDQQGQQEQSERNDRWQQRGAVRLARVDDQHRHGYDRRRKTAAMNGLKRRTQPAGRGHTPGRSGVAAPVRARARAVHLPSSFSTPSRCFIAIIRNVHIGQKTALGRSISGVTRITTPSGRLSMDTRYGSKLARTRSA